MSKTQVIKETKVSNSINLNLSQNDLIDLYIQENIERIVAKHSILLEKVKKLVEPKLDTSSIKHNITFIKDGELEVYTSTKGGVTHMPYKRLCKIDKNSYINNISLENLFEYKKVELHTKDISFYTYEIYKIAISNKKEEYSTKEIPASIVKQYNILQTNYNKQLKAYYAELEKINEEALELWQEYQPFINERAIKARFTKKTLSQSEEGLQILNMVSNLNNTPLLGK